MSSPAYINMTLPPQVDICRKSTGVFTHVTESVCYTLSLHPTFLFVSICLDLLPAENINTANLLVAWDIHLSPLPESFTWVLHLPLWAFTSTSSKTVNRTTTQGTRRSPSIEDSRFRLRVLIRFDAVSWVASFSQLISAAPGQICGNAPNLYSPPNSAYYWVIFCLLANKKKPIKTPITS